MWVFAGPCFISQYFVSFLVLFVGEEGAVAFLCCVLNDMSLLSSMTLPRGAMGWSVVCCDSDTLWSYLL